MCIDKNAESCAEIFLCDTRKGEVADLVLPKEPARVGEDDLGMLERQAGGVAPHERI
jgi:hypothetical protein